MCLNPRYALRFSWSLSFKDDAGDVGEFFELFLRCVDPDELLPLGDWESV